MKITKHVVVAEKQLSGANADPSFDTVSALEIDAALLWTAVQAPTAEVFLEATIMVVKPGGSNNYADLYRILGSGNSSGGTISSINLEQIFHWDIAIALNTYGGFVTAVTMDVSGGMVRVRVTGGSDASVAMATTWLKAWANG